MNEATTKNAVSTQFPSATAVLMYTHTPIVEAKTAFEDSELFNEFFFDVNVENQKLSFKVQKKATSEEEREEWRVAIERHAVPVMMRVAGMEPGGHQCMGDDIEVRSVQTSIRSVQTSIQPP